MTQLELGWDLAQAGMALADEAQNAAWKASADRAIHELALGGQEFTAENVRALAGDPAHPNAFGARFHAASQSGLIRRVGYTHSTRPTRHTHPIAVWVGK